MIKSMTGFANLERQFEFGRLTWEIRSVNHRFLEFSLRLPEEFRVLEPSIRECLGRFVKRGKIDATLRWQETPGHAGTRLKLNRNLAGRLLEIHGEICALAADDQKPDATRLMRWPGLVEEESPDAAPMHAAALDMLDAAAKELLKCRTREGEQLATAIEERLEAVAARTGTIRKWLPEIRDALRKKMRDRVQELANDPESERIEQEVAVLAQKMDVDEELDRLDAHVQEARRTLELDGPVGRRLDFLLQEFNRESNTLSSKSVDQRTSQAAVDLKVLIEQMREQAQNVE